MNRVMLSGSSHVVKTMNEGHQTLGMPPRCIRQHYQNVMEFDRGCDVGLQVGHTDNTVTQSWNQWVCKVTHVYHESLSRTIQSIPRTCLWRSQNIFLHMKFVFNFFQVWMSMKKGEVLKSISISRLFHILKVVLLCSVPTCSLYSKLRGVPHQYHTTTTVPIIPNP